MFAQLSRGKEIDVKKHIPNAITVFRIVLAPALLFRSLPEAAFWAVYILCGISDIADGFAARSLRVQSRRGEILDSTADAIFFAVCAIRLIPRMKLGTALILWMAVICAVKAASLAAAFVRRRRFGFIHTPLSRVTGLLIFVFAPFGGKAFFPYAAAVICAVATAASLQELYLNLRTEDGGAVS